MKAVLKWSNRLVSALLIVFIVLVAALVVTNQLTNTSGIFGYQLKTVLSGSMEPGIQTGSIIAIEAVDNEESTEFQKDDIITFINDDEQLVTHRIIDVAENESGVTYTTKGDNNDTADTEPVLSSNIVGEYQGFTIPYLGYLVNFAQSPNGILLLMIVPGVFMLLYSGFTIWSTLRKLEKNQRKSLEAK